MSRHCLIIIGNDPFGDDINYCNQFLDWYKIYIICGLFENAADRLHKAFPCCLSIKNDLKLVIKEISKKNFAN